MEEPCPCPSSVPVRRNPPRRAKTPAPTPTATASLNTITPAPRSVARRRGISAVNLQEIFECELPPPPPPPLPPTSTSISTSTLTSSTTTITNSSQNLRVFLRIKPQLTNCTSNLTRKPLDGAHSKSNLPTKKKPIKKNEPQPQNQSCLVVNDPQSVTLTPPQNMQDSKRPKSEVYDGFTHVFDGDSTQNQVYEKVMEPLVLDFLKGKSGMITAMGPTGSGKTHTVFGSPRQPGILSLAFANLFGGEHSSSSYYMSMFEINSERKSERLIDLLSSDGTDISLQQSILKGIREETISSIVEAELMIARGTLRRATAMTNSNSQSSRSQCIINIRCVPEVTCGEVEGMPNNAVLTIVDLAGAEREKKTGNQGARLMESNFINTTSMVFGLCLRSLLEHQKNPKKPLQKHFQNSLLTKYLRDYLEGKKRMALVLTVKSGSDDYLDASFLLRQASPYMKIKFNIVEEPYQKRNVSKLPREEKSKRRKLSDPDAYKIDEGDSGKDGHPIVQQDAEPISGPPQQLEPVGESVSPSTSVTRERNESALLEEYSVELERMKRNEKVMQKFSKALWNVLKQYKKKLEDSENEVQVLKNCLEDYSRFVVLDKDIEDMKSSSSFRKHSTEPSSCIQAAGNPRSPELKNSVSNLEGTDAITERCPEILPETESSSAEVGSSDLSIRDPKKNENESNEISAAIGTNVECLHDKDVEVKEGLTSTEREDSSASSAVEQVLVGDTSSSQEVSEEIVDTHGASEVDSENVSPCKSLNEKKPRRRLLPASSILLKDINNLGLEDENERPTGNRGGRKAGAEGNNRTQGSISLLKLLNNLKI